MELTHSFTVPVDTATAWATFEDIAGVAECFPGAVVTSVEGDTFEGTCKVKLGPIALQYGGSGSFVERDEAAGRFVLDAKGKDKRGNGTAGAHVTATFTEEGSSTKVEVVTDLQITGKPAQFGRGVIQDVSDKLLGQFVECLQSKIGSGAEDGPEVALPAPTDAAAEEPAEEPAAVASPVPDPAAARTAPRTPPAAPTDDALDLGATVLPILAKTYWKQLAGGVLALLAIWRLLRR